MTNKISACLMVKNEQDMLPGCLDSIVDWVDEIIVVDTGSTDDTIKIAKQYGAKVYCHKWQNDFSLHRNQTITYATGDWVCIIDADERFSSDMSHFKERLAKIDPSINGLVVTVSEIKDGEPTTSWISIRFFRKSSGIHYKYAVHNKAVYEGGCAATDIQMHHLGYSLPLKEMAIKHERTEKLLHKRLTDDPEDVVVYFYLCQMKIGQKQYDEAERYGLEFFKRIQLNPNDFQYTSVMYFYMSWIYLHKNDGNKAADWALKGLEFYPDDIDLNFIMARLGYQANRDDWLAKYSAKYFELLPLIKKRGIHDNDQFESVLSGDMMYNRTTYTANEAAENDIKKFIEVLYKHG